MPRADSIYQFPDAEPYCYFLGLAHPPAWKDVLPEDAYDLMEQQHLNRFNLTDVAVVYTHGDYDHDNDEYRKVPEVVGLTRSQEIIDDGLVVEGIFYNTELGRRVADNIDRLMMEMSQASASAGMQRLMIDEETSLPVTSSQRLSRGNGLSISKFFKPSIGGREFDQYYPDHLAVVAPDDMPRYPGCAIIYVGKESAGKFIEICQQNGGVITKEQILRSCASRESASGVASSAPLRANVDPTVDVNKFVAAAMLIENKKRRTAASQNGMPGKDRLRLLLPPRLASVCVHFLVWAFSSRKIRAGSNVKKQKHADVVWEETRVVIICILPEQRGGL